LSPEDLFQPIGHDPPHHVIGHNPSHQVIGDDLPHHIPDRS
jgi:hypothetical protein